jgi:uncharacterized protein (TIGR02145 family)
MPSSNSKACTDNSYGPSSPLTYEGQTYKTVKIGCQTWMAENLNYNANGSECYDNNPANCAIYGRLYDFGTAMMACPIGWHLPTNDEWDILINFAGGSSVAGKHLKATTNWRSDDGLDTYGFMALPGGGPIGKYSNSNIGDDGYWWTSDATNETTAFCVLISLSNRDAMSFGHIGSWNLFSVRCLKD